MSIDELESLFWKEQERMPFSCTSVALFSLVVRRIKDTEVRGPVMLPWRYIQSTLGISAPNTLSKAIKELTERNILIYEHKKNRSTFWLVNLDTNCYDNNSKVYSNQYSKPYSNVYSKPYSEPYSKPYSNESSGVESDKPVEATENRTDTSKTDVFSDDFLSQFSDFELKKESSKERNNNINNNNINNINNKNKIQDNPIKQGLSQNLQANPEIIPPWKTKLNKYERDIIDTWETVIGEFSPEWVPQVKQVLQACYPMQVKNAITTMARTKGEVMMTEGFPYLAEPLLKGAFGKRSTTKPKKSKTGSPFLDNKIGGLLTFMEEERKRKQQEQEKAGGG